MVSRARAIRSAPPRHSGSAYVPLSLVAASGGRAGPLVNVTLCPIAPSFQVQVTVPPDCTRTLSEWNARFCRLTAADVGGVVATSVKSAEPATPLTVALTRCVVAEPTESLVLATPFVPVVLWSGFTAPEPLLDVTVHVTTTPGTGRPLRSTTVTLNGTGSGLLKYQLCPPPPLTPTSAGGPGGGIYSDGNLIVNNSTIA